MSVNTIKCQKVFQAFQKVQEYHRLIAVSQDLYLVIRILSQAFFMNYNGRLLSDDG